MKKKILGLLILLITICPAFVNADQHYLGLEQCAKKESPDGIMICDDGKLNKDDKINVTVPVYTSYDSFDIVLSVEYDHNILELVEMPKNGSGFISYEKDLYNKEGIVVSSYSFNSSGIANTPSLGYVFKVKNASVDNTTVKFKSNMEFSANSEGNDGELTFKINKDNSINIDEDNQTHTSDNINSSNNDTSILNNDVLLISIISLNAVLVIAVILLLIKRK